jgi:hypothetical protein
MNRRSNELRMSFAEWFFRLCQANVPYQARGLAVCAVLYKVPTNDELASLSGMDMKGIADKTYNRWKKQLRDDGWVIVKSTTTGRLTTIEVTPAYQECPVTFTDVRPKDVRKFYDRSARKNYDWDVEITDEQRSSAVEVTVEQPSPSVEITGERGRETEKQGSTVKVTAETPSTVIFTDETASRAPAYSIPSGLVIPSSSSVELEDRSHLDNIRLHTSAKTAKRATPRPKPTAEQFAKFWEAYPKRVGKPKTLEKFNQLTPEEADLAIEGAKAYAAECRAEGTEKQFIKWPQGWLGERRFEDYDPSNPPSISNDHLVGPDGEKWGWWRGKEATLRALPVDRWRAAIVKLNPNGTWPWWKLAAPPGDPECLVPEVLLDEFGYVEIYKGRVSHG